MRLALSLRRTLGELAEMPGHEFELWMAFIQNEPIGEKRMDFRFGFLQAQIASLGGAKNVKPTDFIPTWGEEEEIIEAPQNDPDFYREQFTQMQNGE